jgi:hypothetical protein
MAVEIPKYAKNEKDKHRIICKSIKIYKPSAIFINYEISDS